MSGNFQQTETQVAVIPQTLFWVFCYQDLTQGISKHGFSVPHRGPLSCPSGLFPRRRLFFKSILAYCVRNVNFEELSSSHMKMKQKLQNQSKGFPQKAHDSNQAYELLFSFGWYCYVCILMLNADVICIFCSYTDFIIRLKKEEQHMIMKLTGHVSQALFVSRPPKVGNVNV